MIITLAVAPVVLAAETASTGGLPTWVTSVLLPLLLAIGGGGGLFQLLTVRSSKNTLNAGTEKIKAEAADILADSAVSLLGPLREELDRLRDQVNEQRIELRDYRAQMREMEVLLAQERATSDTRIRQLEVQIAQRDQQIDELRGQGGLS